MNKKKQRVSVFVDGFNVYHAIEELKKPHLLWVNLRKLASHFCDPSVHDLAAVWYFSAYATWRRDSHARHIEYVKALESVGVQCVMGAFKLKDRRCPKCSHAWKGHEEKQSDVNFAVHLFHEAQQGNFDEAFLVTRDSDLVPPVRLAKAVFPGATFKVIAPPERRHSKELMLIADKKASIAECHLEQSLFPREVADPRSGRVVAIRPQKYDPPHRPPAN